MKTKTEIKIKKQFPFFYFHKRPYTQIEITLENARKAQNLMFAAMQIIIGAKIISFFKKN